MHVLAGLDAPRLRGDHPPHRPGCGAAHRVSDRQLTAARRDHIGFIFQAYNLVPAMTAQENILLPASLGGRTVDHVLLRSVTERLDLTDRLHHRPAELSGASSSGSPSPGRWSHAQR